VGRGCGGLVWWGWQGGGETINKQTTQNNKETSGVGGGDQTQNKKIKTKIPQPTQTPQPPPPQTHQTPTTTYSQPYPQNVSWGPVFFCGVCCRGSLIGAVLPPRRVRPPSPPNHQHALGVNTNKLVRGWAGRGGVLLGSPWALGSSRRSVTFWAGLGAVPSLVWWGSGAVFVWELPGPLRFEVGESTKSTYTQPQLYRANHPPHKPIPTKKETTTPIPSKQPPTSQNWGRVGRGVVLVGLRGPTPAPRAGSFMGPVCPWGGSGFGVWFHPPPKWGSGSTGW